MVMFPTLDPGVEYPASTPTEYAASFAKAKAIAAARKKATKATTTTSKKTKPAATFQITTAEGLTKNIQTEITAFIQRLPGLFTFKMAVKASYRSADGKLHRGNFAVLDVYAKTKRSGNTLFEEIPLGTITANLAQPLTVAGQTLASQLEASLKAGIASYLPVAAASPVLGPNAITDVGTVPAAKPVAGGISLAEFLNNSIIHKSNLYWFVDRFGVQHNIVGATAENLKSLGITPQEVVDTMSGGTFGSNYAIDTLITQATLLLNDFNIYQAALAAAAVVTPAQSTIPKSVFIENSPYKYKDNPTIWIYYNGQMHGVTSAAAFAKYFNADYKTGDDLNQIRAILPMPDLTGFTVPTNLFDGTLIS